MALPLTMWGKTKSLTQIQCGGIGCGTDTTFDAGSAGAAPARQANDNRHTATGAALRIPALEPIEHFFWSVDQYATIQHECKSRESAVPPAAAPATTRPSGSSWPRASS